MKYQNNDVMVKSAWLKLRVPRRDTIILPGPEKCRSCTGEPNSALILPIDTEMHQSTRKRVMVYLNEGDATKWKRQVIATTGSHNLCVADIGNNGALDIIGANWSGDYQPVEMWKQN